MSGNTTPDDTNPTDRIAEIEARREAATPGLTLGEPCDEGIVYALLTAEDAACLERAPSDIDYLLAELKKRDEVIEQCEVAMLAALGEIETGVCDIETCPRTDCATAKLHEAIIAYYDLRAAATPQQEGKPDE